MTLSDNYVKISDVAIWFSHIHAPDLVEKLKNLPPEQEVSLETDGVVGRWQRMRTGTDGREVFAIRPVGPMKAIWGDWFRNRKGEIIEVKAAAVADDYLAAASALFSEWASPEDEEAFRDL